MRIGTGNASLRPGFRGAGLAHIATMLRGLSGGGTERVALAVAGGLAACGHRVDLVFPDSPERFYPARIPEGVRPVFCGAGPEARAHTARFTIPDNALWLADRPCLRERLRLVFGLLRHPEHFALFRPRVLRRAFALLPYLRHERPDVVFANSPSLESPLNILLQNQMVTPPPRIIPVIHGLIGRKAKRRCISFLAASRIVAVSESVAKHVSELCGIAPEKITIIHNPAFSLNILELAQSEPDHPWFSDGGPQVVLAVGRLAAEKDLPTLLEAFRQIVPLYRLIILGEGPMRPLLESRVRHLKLEDWVCLPGWKENPFSFMAHAALLVLSSRGEGFGNVLVEAMARGCPAVSTDCPGGPSEILDDPSLLAPIGDPEGLARVMLRVLSRPPTKAVLCTKASRFSAEQAVAKYDEIVSAVIGKRQGLSARAARPAPVPVYVINLDRRPDRWTTMSEQLDRLGIAATRIPAVDARLLAEDHRELQTTSLLPWRSRSLTFGEAACICSHRKALRAFLDSDAPAALILEDDVQLTLDTPALLESVDWWPLIADVIRLEAESLNYIARIGLWPASAETPSGRRLHRFERWHLGSAAYLVNRNGAKLVMDGLSTTNLPVDVALFDHRYSPLARKLKALQIVPGMARQTEGATTSDLYGWQTNEQGASLAWR